MEPEPARTPFDTAAVCVGVCLRRRRAAAAAATFTRGNSLMRRLCRYSRLEVDTLFFIFYFQPSTRQQQLAAKALRASGWLFNMQVTLLCV